MAESLPADLSKVDPSEAWKPWTPSASTPWNRKWVAHLYRRAAFGPSSADTKRALADGLPKTLDRLMAGEPGAAELLEMLADAGRSIASGSEAERLPRLRAGLRETQYHALLVGYHFDTVAVHHPRVDHHHKRLGAAVAAALLAVVITVFRLAPLVVTGQFPQLRRLVVFDSEMADEQEQDVFARPSSAGFYLCQIFLVDLNGARHFRHRFAASLAQVFQLAAQRFIGNLLVVTHMVIILLLSDIWCKRARPTRGTV